ncbi:hypothetical protein [Nocardia fluminea]|uniref:hypothetical protein n=1 Tax=Nocardia fluminea TaxID=134984 RepID=UPI003444D879
MISRFASPGEDYLARIGELAYAVSSMEWTLLGDLHRLTRVTTTPGLTAVDLAGHTTGTIGKAFLAATARDPAVQHYFRVGGEGLCEVSRLRNAVLHARPATHPQQNQRLNRWIVSKRLSERFWIDDDWLTATLTRIAEIDSALRRVRPSFEAYPYTPGSPA